MIDFTLPPELAELRDRARAFVENEVIPQEPFVDDHDGLPQDRLDALRARARSAGIYAPHVPKEWGGLGLNMREMSIVFEEAGRSLIGPLALNCAAPDEGNMHLLAVVGTAAQQEQYLRPLVEGRVRSSFSMTEPPRRRLRPLDAAHPRRAARRRLGHQRRQVVHQRGRRLRLHDLHGRHRRADRRARRRDDVPGRRRQPRLPHRPADPLLDAGFAGGHCEVEFRDCAVGQDAVLGAVGEGFKYAQVRLAPARLTHCMRWLGVAARALDIAATYANGRAGFGKPLGQHQMVQQMIADSAMELHASRLMIWHAAWVIDGGGQARQETSMAKTYVSEAVDRVVDRALQITGSHGVSNELPLASFYRNVRPFRIYDGPSEVHRMVIAQRILREAAAKPAAGIAPTTPEVAEVTTPIERPNVASTMVD